MNVLVVKRKGIVLAELEFSTKPDSLMKKRNERYWGNPPKGKKPWPCRTCRGDGKIYDPDDPIDPVEGSKWRRRIPCPDCKDGDIGREKFVKLHNEEMAKWQAERDAVYDLADDLAAIVSRLSDDEVKTLAKAMRQKPFYGGKKIVRRICP